MTTLTRAATCAYCGHLHVAGGRCRAVSTHTTNRHSIACTREGGDYPNSILSRYENRGGVAVEVFPLCWHRCKCPRFYTARITVCPECLDERHPGFPVSLVAPRSVHIDEVHCDRHERWPDG